ncbi:MAG: glycosyltransferase family 2 protein [Acidobacteriota bacterium]
MINGKQREPSVCIVVLNYNGWEDTVECVNSLLKTKYTNYKIVIVDNDSEDDSIHKISGYFRNKSLVIQMVESYNGVERISRPGKIIMIRAGKNGGYGYGNNVGIRFAMANGADYVMILNNDTVVDPDFLNPLVNKCESDKNIGIVSGKVLYYNRPEYIWFIGGRFSQWTGKIIHYNMNEKDTNLIPSEKINFISGCMWFIPVEVIREVGYINEEYFMYMEDIDYCQRMLKGNYKLSVVKESRIWHKAGDGDKSFSRFSVYWRSRNYIILLKRTEPCFFRRVLKVLLFNIFYSLRLIKYMKINRLPDQFRGMLNGILHGKQKQT